MHLLLLPSLATLLSAQDSWRSLLHWSIPRHAEAIARVASGKGGLLSLCRSITHIDQCMPSHLCYSGSSLCYEGRRPCCTPLDLPHLSSLASLRAVLLPTEDSSCPLPSEVECGSQPRSTWCRRDRDCSLTEGHRCCESECGSKVCVELAKELAVRKLDPRESPPETAIDCVFWGTSWCNRDEECRSTSVHKRVCRSTRCGYNVCLLKKGNELIFA